MSVIFLGTSSGAGKTTVAAMYCRHLHRIGAPVAPFKASNLSNSSVVTRDGGEIGIGQAFQAECCGIVPEADMNPVLLKPSGAGGIATTVLGEELGMHDDPDRRLEMLRSAVCRSYDRISREYGNIVCEGSGSPVELNLLDRDLANTGLMRSRSVPAILVGDIERGGVFAALYGTWLLIPEDVRHLVRGFIINRFRGDPSILDSGIDMLQELTGMECFGVIPYARLVFPEEDSLSDPCGPGNTGSVFTDNMDSLLDLAEDSGLDLDGIDLLSGVSRLTPP